MGSSRRNMESVPADGASEAVEKAFGHGIEWGHGGSEHEQPICDPKHVSLTERADVFEIGKGHRPQSLRRRPGARASRSDSGSKEDGQPDPAVVGSVGVGTLPDPTP